MESRLRESSALSTRLQQEVTDALEKLNDAKDELQLSGAPEGSGDGASAATVQLEEAIRQSKEEVLKLQADNGALQARLHESEEASAETERAAGQTAEEKLALQAQVETLKSALHDADAATVVLRQEVATGKEAALQHKTEQQHLQAKLAAAGTKVETLNASLADNTAALAAAVDAAAKHENAVSGLTQSMQEAGNQEQAWADERATLVAQKEGAEAKVASLNTALEAKGAELVGASGQSAALSSQVESNAAECAKLAADLAAKAAEVAELSEARDALKDSVRVRDAELAEAKAALDRETQGCGKLRDEHETLTKDASGARETLQVLQAAHGESEAKIAQQVSQITALKQALDGASAQATEGQAEQATVAQLVDENASLKVRVGQAESDLAAEGAQLQALRASADEAAAAAGKATEAVQAQVGELESANRDLARSLEDAQAASDASAKQAQDAQDKLQDLGDQHKSTRSELAETKSAVAALQAERDGVQQSLDTLRLACTEQDATLSGVQSQTAEVQNALALKENQLATKTSLADALQAKVCELEKAQSEARAAHEAALATERTAVDGLNDKVLELETAQGLSQKSAELKKAESTAKAGRVDELQARVADLQAASEAAQKAASDKEADLAKLQAGVTKAKAKVAELEAAQKLSKTAMSLKEKELAAKVAKIDELQKRAAASSKAVAGTKGPAKKLIGAKGDKQKLQDKAEKLQDKAAKLQTQVHELEASLAEATAQHGYAEEKVATLKTDLAAAKEEVQAVKMEKFAAGDKVVALTRENAELKMAALLQPEAAQVQSAATDLTVGAGEQSPALVSELQGQVRELQLEVEDKAEMIAFAEAQLREAQTGIDEAIDLQAENFELSASVEQWQAALEVCRSDLANYRTTALVAESQLAGVRADVVRLEGTLGELYDIPSDSLGQKRLLRKLYRDKMDIASEVSRLTVELETKETLLLEASQELEDGGRVVELEAALAEAQEQLEKSTGRRPTKRLRGVMPLVNVRALQSEKDLLEQSNIDLQEEKRTLAKQLKIQQETLDHCEDEIHGLQERLRKLSPFGAKGNDEAKAKAPAEKKKRRLFCDVCETFDEHDTADCPLMQDGPSLSRKKNVEVERPYCAVCETFEHSTEDCDAGVDPGAGEDEDDFF